MVDPDSNARATAAATRRALAGFGWYGAAGIAERLLRLATTAVLTRWVDIAAYGQWTILSTWLVVLTTVADLGIGSAAMRFGSGVSEENRERVRATLGLFRIGAGGALSVSAWSALWLTGARPLGISTAALAAFASLPFLSGVADLSLETLRMRAHHGTRAFFLVLQDLLGAAAAVGAVVTLPDGLLALTSAAAVASSVVAIAASIAVGGLPRVRPTGELARTLFRFGFPVMLAYSASVLLALDRWLVERLVGLAAAAAYQIASLPCGAIVLLERPAFQVSEPLVYGGDEDQARAAIRGILFRAVLVAWLVAAGLSLIAPEALALVAPAPYLGSIDATPWLILATAHGSLLRLVGISLGIVRRNRAWALAASAELLVSGIAALVLGLRWGALGVALGRFVGSCLGIGLGAVASRRLAGIALPVLSIVAVSAGLGAALSAALALPLLYRWLLLVPVVAAAGWLVLRERRRARARPTPNL